MNKNITKSGSAWKNTAKKGSVITFNKIRIISLILVLSVSFITLTSCSAKAANQEQEQAEFDPAKDIAVIEMKNGGIIKVELYPDQAPITVNNFVLLARQGFYNGLTFHRVIEGFMIQGGDPKGDGTGGSPTKIKGEFKENKVNNTISHTRGVISMARGGKMDSASSQFFIMHGDAAGLDGKYAAFGKVIEGMDVVDEIATTKCDNSNPNSPKPLVPQVIKEIRIEAR